MLDHNVTVTATFGTKTYKATYGRAGGLVAYGSVSGSDKTKAGDAVELTVSPTEGCQIQEMRVWNYKTSGPFSVEPDENGNYSFIMPVANVEVQYAFEQVRFTVTLADSANGTVNFADGYTGPFEAGSWVHLTIRPNEGYALDTVTVTGDSGRHTTSTTVKTALRYPKKT